MKRFSDEPAANHHNYIILNNSPQLHREPRLVVEPPGCSSTVLFTVTDLFSQLQHAAVQLDTEELRLRCSLDDEHYHDE